MTAHRKPNPDNRWRCIPRQPPTANRTPIFGVPQKRKRAFFFVTRRSLDPQRIDDLLARHKVPPVTTREALHGLPTPAVRPDIYSDDAEVRSPANHFAMRHSKRVMDKIAAIPPGTGPMSYRRLHPVRPANTLFSGHRSPPASWASPRPTKRRGRMEQARAWLAASPDRFLQDVARESNSPMDGQLMRQVWRMVACLIALAAKQTGLCRLQEETHADRSAFTSALLANPFRRDPCREGSVMTEWREPTRGGVSVHGTDEMQCG